MLCDQRIDLRPRLEYFHGINRQKRIEIAADAGCVHRVEATLDEYEDVRSDGATFILAPGHSDGAIEAVVDDRGRFHVVEKIQETVRATVRRLNPRLESA